MKRLLLGILALVYAVSLFSLVFGLGGYVNSPDENANLFFAQRIAQAETIAYPVWHLSDTGITHPRSTIIVQGAIVPGSFLGLILVAGLFGLLFGSHAVFFVTPLFALCGLYALYKTVEHVFDRSTAIVATTLFAIHPAFWYYGMRSMMHNVGFVSLLLMGMYWLLCRPLKTFWINCMLAGLSFGLALAFRTSEAIWVLPSICLLIVVMEQNWKQKMQTVIACMIGCAVILGIVLSVQHALYGSPFLTGYTVTPDAISIPATEVVKTAETAELPAWLSYVLPFGLHERAILRNVWQYGFMLFPWMSVFAGIGLLLSVVEKQKTWRHIALYTIGLAAWLGALYGSWVFFDNPDKSIVTIGNSYIRYWLPLFALGSVFAAKAILRIGEFFAKKYHHVITIMILVACTLLSAQLIYFGHDGIIPTRQAIATFQEKEEMILLQTDENAVIVVDMADKYLFPERLVVTPLRSEATYANLSSLVDTAPVYYFGITLPEQDMMYLNEVILAPYQLVAKPIETVDDETLYGITRQ